ncbi:MAG: hypothetical protein V3R83_09850 [Gammaproteobacteria bacterium]
MNAIETVECEKVTVISIRSFIKAGYDFLSHPAQQSCADFCRLVDNAGDERRHGLLRIESEFEMTGIDWDIVEHCLEAQK